jgi:hypothetical protein
MDPMSEMQAREDIDKAGMVIVGWYHSHPVFKPEPSVCDAENQQQYQHLFKDQTSLDEPFLGIIIAPYDSMKAMADVSQMRCFWIATSATKKGTPSFLVLSFNLNVFRCTKRTPTVTLLSCFLAADSEAVPAALVLFVRA